MFIDGHSRHTWTYLMKAKSETSSIFQYFYYMVQTQFNAKIQILITDNAKDYFNTVLGQFLTKHGVVHLSSCVETPQQNGIAERKNRHLLDVAHACMFARQVPKYLWGEAVLTATYLMNRMLAKFWISPLLGKFFLIVILKWPVYLQIFHPGYLVALYLFTLTRIIAASLIRELTSVSLLGILLTKKATSAILLLLNKRTILVTLPSLKPNLSFTTLSSMGRLLMTLKLLCGI